MIVHIPRRRAEIGLYALALALAVAAFLHTASFPAPLLRGYPGAAMFPRLVIGGMAAFSVLGLGRALALAASGAAEGPPLRFPAGPFAVALLALGMFALLMSSAGMELAVFALIAGGLWFRTRRFVAPAMAGLGAIVVVYLLFVQALSVHLPLTILPRYPGWF